MGRTLVPGLTNKQLLWIGAGSAAFWGLLYLNRKSLKGAVGRVAYAALPPCETFGPEPDAERSLDALSSSFRTKVIGLQLDLRVALGRVGYTLDVAETYRTLRRQLWLWGIGRVCRARGRSGIVTQVKMAGKHGARKAVDFLYRPIAGGAGDAKVWLPVISQIAPILERKYGIKWGGSWVSWKDYPHWQDSA